MDKAESRNSVGYRSVSLPTTAAPQIALRTETTAPPQVVAKDFEYSNWEIPHLTKTPWEVDRYRKSTVYRLSKAQSSHRSQNFKPLPREVYDCILVQLKHIHFSTEHTCPSCYLKDLVSLSLTCRAWDKAATAQLYVNPLRPHIQRLSLNS